MLVAVIAVSIALGGGVSMGLVAGYAGGAVDQALSRFIDAMLAFPGVLLAIAVTSALGPSRSRKKYDRDCIIGIPLLPFLALPASGAPGLRGSEYVTAAAVLGRFTGCGSDRHIMPNIANPLIVQPRSRAHGDPITGSTSSFIGIGPQPPQIRTK